MAAKYTQQYKKSVTDTSLGIGTLESNGTASRRLKIYDFIFGSDAATLGTSNWRVEITRSSTAATGGSSAIHALDPNDDGNSLCSVTRVGITANGTLVSGNIPLSFPLNEQATFRWIAPPNGEIIIAGTSGAGVHILTPVAGNTPSAVAQLYWEE